MGFRENKNKLGTRVRSAFDRLKPSKSTIEMSNIMKGELSMIRAVSPMPLPVLTLSSSISCRLVSSTLLEGVMRDSLIYHEPRSYIKSSQEHHKPTHLPVEVYKIDSLTAHDKVQQREGLLASPINLRLASPTQLPLDSPEPPVSIPKAHRSLARSHKLGPFTPELEKNPAGDTPEHTPSTTALESNAYFPKTKSAINQPRSRSSSPSSVYSDKCFIIPSSRDKEAWLTPENPTHQEVKSSVLPARHFLRRRGPTPTTQSLSSRLLQAIVSSPTEKTLSLQSRSTSSESDIELSSHHERLCLGVPMSRELIDQALESALLARTEPLQIAREEFFQKSYSSSASSSMTDITGPCSNSSS